ncbi:fused MFS/spermidine synthase [Neoroseomonas marina]
MTTNYTLPGDPETIRDRPYPLPPLRRNEFWMEPLDPAKLGHGPIYSVEDSDPFDLYSYRVLSVAHASQTAFQRVVVADTCNYGRALFMDGSIQSAQEDEALYHELLVQPGMLCHHAPRDVLIIGGGEGATLREVLAHASVRSAVMVDIDAEAVEICRKHMVHAHQGAFDDPRARLVFQDGRRFVEETDLLFDVVIIDVVDNLDNGPAQALYTRQFYQLLRRRLRPEGIIMIQGLEFSFQDYKEHAALVRTLRTVFAEVHSYNATVPSFLGSWGFIMASDWLDPSTLRADAIDRQIERRLGHDWLRHLNGAFLLSAFALCKETRYVLALPGPILEDGVPFLPPPDVGEAVVEQVRLPVLDERAWTR